MFGKIKKIFFTGVFGVLYISFIAQLVYVLGWVAGIENKLIGLGLLTLEWLVLIAARYLPHYGRAEGGMVHVGIAAEEHHIHFVPAAQFHLFLRGGQPVGRLVVGGMVHGGMWVDGFNGSNWSNKTNRPNKTDWSNETDWLDWLSG